MNRVQACRTMDERSEGVAPIAGLDAPFDELAAPVSGRRARSAADTLRYSDADPFADTLTAHESAVSARLARPDWCVDLESALVSMTTFELWAAIEHGRVAPTARVWREGLECWTRVDHLPELGWAFPVTSAPPPEPAPAATPVSFAPPGAAAPRREPPPASAPAPTLVTPRRASGSGRWIALGSGVAAAALAAALVVVSLRAPAPPPAPQPFAGAAPRAELDATPAPERPEEVSHHDERGQRRLPRGGRRAYGR